MGSTFKEEDEVHEPIKDKDITTYQPPFANDKEKVARLKKNYHFLNFLKKGMLMNEFLLPLTFNMSSLPFILIRNGPKIG
jgi:hypothetical protein